MMLKKRKKISLRKINGVKKEESLSRWIFNSGSCIMDFFHGVFSPNPYICLTCCNIAQVSSLELRIHRENFVRKTTMFISPASQPFHPFSPEKLLFFEFSNVPNFCRVLHHAEFSWKSLSIEKTRIGPDLESGLKKKLQRFLETRIIDHNHID